MLPPEEWTEKELSSALADLCRTLNWRAYHTYDSRRSRHGYPDWTLARDRVVFAELKREKGKPTPDQIAWLDGLAAADAEVYLWRPSDLDEIGAVLGRRWTFLRPASAGLGILDFKSVPAEVLDFWKPRSLWVGGATHGELEKTAAAA